MRINPRLPIVGILLASAALPAAASEVYSVFWDNRFGAIDSSTGAFSQISTLPIAQSAGIANDDGTLYALGMNDELINIDPSSGASSVIGSSGLQYSPAGFAGGMNGLFEIDYESNLYSINPATGAATLIGNTGLPANNGSWDTSLSDDGTNLYFTAGTGGSVDTLYEINTSTGQATDLGSTGVSGIAGSAIVNGDLDLFQYHWGGGTDYIYSAALGSTDFTQGAVLQTQIVDGGVVLGTTSYAETAGVPEPDSLLLLGSALIGLALWRRRGNPGISPIPKVSKTARTAQFPVN